MELEPWTSRRRDDLLQMLEEMERRITQLNATVEQAAAQRPEAVLLMSHPGVGPILALATVLTLGDVSRFPRGKHVASYLGLIPKEASSGQRRRLGAISKQGNSFMRFLLVQAGMSAARGDAGLSRVYQRLLAQRKHHGVAKVAVARRLVVRLYWMLREKKQYPAVVRMQGSPSHPVVAVMTVALNGRSASQAK